MRTAFKALFFVGIITAVSCSGKSDTTYKEELQNLDGSDIVEAEARFLITLFVNEELASKTFKDIDGSVHRYRKFTPESWRLVEFKENRWIARCDPPAGQHVTASLDRSGMTPKIDRYGYATH